MAKRFKKKRAGESRLAPVPAPKDLPHQSIFRMATSGVWIPLLLAAITFLVYWPSLHSDFVYDAHKEILEEGFITSISNLPAVLSLKVLGMNLMLADRPGQLLYLMLIAAVCGKAPFGYHLCSNLLHAANVALLFVLLRRLIATEITGLTKSGLLKVQLATATVTLIFALHPIAVEPVAAVNYSSDLLMTFFTLGTLILATTFRPENVRTAWITGILGTFCAFAAVACKESGAAAAPLLIIYWFLFRRNEARRPWLLFLGAALTATAAFLAARFLCGLPGPTPLGYLGGSFSQVFWVQPRLWVFMMGKLLWPTQFSADYTSANWNWISTAAALTIMALVILLQARLAWRSPSGALGVAIYWLGLATVSNFMPLNRILADRFYYLPLAGFALQLLALLLLTLRSRAGFWMIILPMIGALPLLLFLTVSREAVFANDFFLWTDTLRVSPLSRSAHNSLGIALFRKGRVDGAVAQFQKSLEISPDYVEAHNNLGIVLAGKGRLDEAIAQFQDALAVNPNVDSSHNDLGNALLHKGQIDEAIGQFQKALVLNPIYVEAYANLGNALLQKGQTDQAIGQFRKALAIDPTYAESHRNLGLALLEKGQVDEASNQFEEAVKFNPDDIQAYNSLGIILAKKGQLSQAIVEFQEALRRRPDYRAAQNNLNKANAMLQRGTFPK